MSESESKSKHTGRAYGAIALRVSVEMGFIYLCADDIADRTAEAPLISRNLRGGYKPFAN